MKILDELALMSLSNYLKGASTYQARDSASSSRALKSHNTPPKTAIKIHELFARDFAACDFRTRQNSKSSLFHLNFKHQVP